MSKFFIHEGLLCRSYITAHLRRRDIFRDQLVVPKSLRKLVINACRDLQASGGHLLFKSTLDESVIIIGGPRCTMHSDVVEQVESCLSCQHRKTCHRPPTLPTGHGPVTKSFQVVAVDLVEYKSKSEGNRFILSIIDHLARFLILIPIKSEEAAVVVRHLIDRVFSMFDPPEPLHSENQLVK